MILKKSRFILDTYLVDRPHFPPHLWPGMLYNTPITTPVVDHKDPLVATVRCCAKSPTARCLGTARIIEIAQGSRSFGL